MVTSIWVRRKTRRANEVDDDGEDDNDDDNDVKDGGDDDDEGDDNEDDDGDSKAFVTSQKDQLSGSMATPPRPRRDIIRPFTDETSSWLMMTMMRQEGENKCNQGKVESGGRRGGGRGRGGEVVTLDLQRPVRCFYHTGLLRIQVLHPAGCRHMTVSEGVSQTARLHCI